MIFDLEKNNFSEERVYDVCIFGAGPAGISLALKLHNNNKRVLICEAGDENIQNNLKIVIKGSLKVMSILI